MKAFRIRNPLVVSLVIAIVFHAYRCDCSGGERLIGDAVEDQVIEENPPLPMTWARTIGSLFDKEWATSVFVVPDGYLVIGQKEWIQGGDEASWVVKLDARGEILWSKLFDNVYNERLYSVQPTGDGGYILCGSSFMGRSLSASWVLSLDREGSLRWQKIYHEHETFESNYAYSIAQAEEDGFLVAGYHRYDDVSYLLILMLDEEGGLRWSKIYLDEFSWWGASLMETQDGGFILVGSAANYPAQNIILMKLDHDLNAQWTKSYDGNRDLAEHSMQQTSDGGYVLIGINNLSTEPWDFEPFVLRLDPNGSVLWQIVLRADSMSIRVSSITQSPDGGHLLVGSLTPLVPLPDGREDTDLFIIKLDEGGAIAWQRAYGGSDEDTAADIQTAQDGGYIVVGKSLSFGDGRSETWILKLDENGEMSENCSGQLRSSEITAVASSAAATDAPPTAAAAGNISEFSDTHIGYGEFNETMAVQCED